MRTDLSTASVDNSPSASSSRNWRRRRRCRAVAGRGLLSREFAQEHQLRRARQGAARLLARVMTVGAHVPGLAVVLEVGLEPLLDDALLEFLFEHRKAQLDAAKKVAVHPVGAGEVDV